MIPRGGAPPHQVDAQKDFVLVLPTVELSGTNSHWVGTARAMRYKSLADLNSCPRFRISYRRDISFSRFATSGKH